MCWGRFVPSLQPPCTARGCPRLQRPDRHGHTCTLEAGGPTPGLMLSRGCVCAVCSPGRGLQRGVWVEAGQGGPRGCRKEVGRVGSPRTPRPPPPSRACLPFPKGWGLGGDRSWSLGNWPQVMKVPGRDLGAGAEHEVPGGQGLGALHPKHTPNAGPGLLAADKPIGGLCEPRPAPGQLQGGSAWGWRWGSDLGLQPPRRRRPASMEVQEADSQVKKQL